MKLENQDVGSDAGSETLFRVSVRVQGRREAFTVRAEFRDEVKQRRYRMRDRRMQAALKQ